MPAPKTNAEARKKLIQKKGSMAEMTGFAQQQHKYGAAHTREEEEAATTSPYNKDGSPKRRIITASPEPLSTYGRAVNNFVNLHLPASKDPTSPVRTVKELSAELSAEMEESVNCAAEAGLTEEELQQQLQDQLHKTVQLSAEAAREDLAALVADAQRHLEAGKAADGKLSFTRQRVSTTVTHTKKDIEGYFNELSRLLDERKEQLLAEADQRLVALDNQTEEVHMRMAQIETACEAASEASEGPDLALLHKKKLIEEKLHGAMAQEWPERPCVDTEMVFHADDSIVAAIMGLGEVTGGINEDPQAVATPELQEVLASADDVFARADKDGDGVIDAQELKELVFFMYTKGGAAPRDLAARMKEEVEASMERFDKDRNSTIDKEEFKRMICSNPWKVLLPESARKNASLMKHYFGL